MITAEVRDTATPAPVAEIAPIVAAKPEPKIAAVDDGTAGPGNNWLQPIHRTDQTKPAEYDFGRQPDAGSAPLGWLKDGRPWSPYGTTEGGRIRRRPAPTMKGREPEPLAAAPVDRRLAPAELKPPANVVGLHAAANDAHKRLNEIVGEIKKAHPESKWDYVPHPKEMASGSIVKADPSVGASTVEDLLKTATAFLAQKVGEPSAVPAPKTLHEAADKISEASKYYNINTDPKTAATWAAVIAVFACFLPGILAAIGKLAEKIRGKA